jgi:hypothetical protein
VSLRQRIPGNWQDALRNVYLWRNLLAIAAIASMMLPWVYLDGAKSSLSGAELIAYTFATGSERWDMLQQNVPGALSLLLIPLIVAVLSVVSFWKIWNEQHPVKLNIIVGLLPLLIVLFAGSITSSEHLIAGRVVFPQAGIILMFLCQGVLAIHSLTRGP